MLNRGLIPRLPFLPSGENWLTTYCHYKGNTMAIKIKTHELSIAQTKALIDAGIISADSIKPVLTEKQFGAMCCVHAHFTNALMADMAGKSAQNFVYHMGNGNVAGMYKLVMQNTQLTESEIEVLAKAHRIVAGLRMRATTIKGQTNA